MSVLLPSTALAVIELDALDLALVAACVLVNAALSLFFRLGLGKPLLIASIRTIVQLFAIGFVLEELFRLRSPPLIVALLIVMGLIAGHAARGRVTRRFRGTFLIATGAMLGSTFLMTAYAIFVVVQPPSWYEPRYLIPLAGMVFGNSLTAVSLALDRFANGFAERRQEVETWIAFGASDREATHPLVVDALRTGMMPMLNAMTVVGVVSLPGMMTGQILGGSPPQVAVRYQILVMFLLAGSTALGSAIAVLAARSRLLALRDA